MSSGRALGGARPLIGGGSWATREFSDQDRLESPVRQKLQKPYAEIRTFGGHVPSIGNVYEPMLDRLPHKWQL